MIHAKLLSRDIRLHLYGVVAAWPHLYRIAQLAAQWGLLLTYEQVYAVEALLLDHPDLHAEKNPQKRFNKMQGAVQWIAGREDGYFAHARPIQLKMDGFPLGIFL